MGQLERLNSRREHGLELYAGGKGHGEPPSIDWAHDYVDLGNFQKLRIKNWARCPNFEVEIGPLMVRCRRWGFPHSPLHPLFTPSRIHVDQTYSFYAGLPLFFKQGRMEAIQDVTVEAMRDDEWVFSGYSFTDLLWIDRAGKLREGPVTREAANDLWGVGFQLQAMMQGNGGDHRIGQADRLADPLQFAGDAAGQLGGRPVESDHFFRDGGCQDLLQLPKRLLLLMTSDHFHFAVLNASSAAGLLDNEDQVGGIQGDARQLG